MCVCTNPKKPSTCTLPRKAVESKDGVRESMHRETYPRWSANARIWSSIHCSRRPSTGRRCWVQVICYLSHPGTGTMCDPCRRHLVSTSGFELPCSSVVIKRMQVVRVGLLCVAWASTNRCPCCGSDSVCSHVRSISAACSLYSWPPPVRASCCIRSNRHDARLSLPKI